MATDLDAILRMLKNTSAAGSQSTPATGIGQLGYGDPGVSTVGANSGLDTMFHSPIVHADFTGQASPDYRSVDDMTFDNTYQTNYDALQRQLASASSDFNDANSAAGPELARVTKAAQDQYGIDQQNLTDKFANNGLLRSGIMEKAQGDLGQGLQNRLADYNRQATESNTQRQKSFAQMQQAIQDQVANLQNEKASREAARQQAIAKARADQLAQSQPNVNNLGQYPNYNFDPIQQQLNGGTTPGQIATNPEFQDPNIFYAPPNETGPAAGDTYATWDNAENQQSAYTDMIKRLMNGLG